MAPWKRRNIKDKPEVIKTPKLTSNNVHHIPIISQRRYLRFVFDFKGLEHAHRSAMDIPRQKCNTNTVESCKILKLLD